MSLRSVVLALSCLLPACAASANESAMALDGDFEAATAMARDQGKLLLIDFTSPRERRWYGPEDKAPWRDEDVQEWIAEHAIAIRIEEDKSPELAKRFGIDFPPILVFLRDGAELDRHTDFDDAAGFLEWAEGVLRGRTRTQRLDDEMSELAEGRAMELWYYATKLVREGSFDDATEVLTKAWDMTRQEQRVAESYLDVLSHEMADLAEEHPPARTAFERLLAETELRTFASDPPRSFDFMQWLELCEVLGKEQRVLSWFEQTRDEDGQLYGSLFAAATNEHQIKVRMLVLEFLIDQRRFDDAARLYENPVQYAGMVSIALRVGRAWAAVLATGADDKSYMGGLPRNVVDARRREIARIHAVTLAAGRAEQADQVAHLLLDDDDDGLGRIALVEASLRLETSPPIEASRWLDEATALGADVTAVRDRLVKVTGSQPRQAPASGG